MAFFYNRNGNLQAYVPGVFPQQKGSTIQFGDGVFETIRVTENGDIPLLDYHWARLNRSLQFYRFNRPPTFGKAFLLEQIQNTISANKFSGAARVRLTIFNHQQQDDNSLPMDFIIEAQALDEGYLSWHENGQILVAFRQSEKQLSVRSPLKQNMRIPYNNALEYAKSIKADDAFVFNSSGSISDTSIANIFRIKNDVIYTPPLSDGPVSGVMRQWLLEQLPAYGYQVKESTCSEYQLLESDEIFVTNALYGIRRVSNVSDNFFSSGKTKEIYQHLIQPLFRSYKKQG